MEREDRGGGDEFGGRYNYIGLIRDDLSSRYGLGSSAQRLLVSSRWSRGAWTLELQACAAHAARATVAVCARVGAWAPRARVRVRVRAACATRSTYVRHVRAVGAGTWGWAAAVRRAGPAAVGYGAWQVGSWVGWGLARGWRGARCGRGTYVRGW